VIILVLKVVLRQRKQARLLGLFDQLIKHRLVLLELHVLKLQRLHLDVGEGEQVGPEADAARAQDCCLLTSLRPFVAPQDQVAQVHLALSHVFEQERIRLLFVNIVGVVCDPVVDKLVSAEGDKDGRPNVQNGPGFVLPSSQRRNTHGHRLVELVGVQRGVQLVQLRQVVLIANYLILAELYLRKGNQFNNRTCFAG